MSTTTEPLQWFRWWYKGKTPEGNIARFEGTIQAEDYDKASRSVEEMMRARWPKMRWMQGREIEGWGWNLGPTVQKMKRGPRDQKPTTKKTVTYA